MARRLKCKNHLRAGRCKTCNERSRTRLTFQQCDQGSQERRRTRRAATDGQINRDHSRDAANACIAAGEDTTVKRAVADGDNPLRVGGRRISSLQCLAHVFRHRPGDKQNVGMPGRRDEAEPKTLQIIKRVVKAWISSSQPLQEPASIWRMESERPSRRRETPSRALASSESAASSGVGGGSVSGDRTRLENSSLRIPAPRDHAPNRSS
jgi:hypothetical protein